MALVIQYASCEYKLLLLMETWQSRYCQVSTADPSLLETIGLVGTVSQVLTLIVKAKNKSITTNMIRSCRKPHRKQIFEGLFCLDNL